MDLVPLAGEGRKDIRTFKKNLRFVFFFLRETPETQKKRVTVTEKLTESYT
jgi:hypothetical protein